MTMKKIALILFTLFITVSCSDSDEVINDPIISDPVNQIPQVSQTETYSVTQFENITYAQGLSHDAINSANSQAVDLKLDLYVPDNDSSNRPVYMFIHGGGFISGDKRGGTILNMANYFTSRGFVFASINYRLKDDFGTIPQPWLNYGALVDAQSVGQYYAIYPAQRDAKAALRWIVANAETYGINTDYITVGGGSAGAITAITLGISNAEDFTNEIDITTDPTLATTNRDRSYDIKTIVNFWGSKVALDSYEIVYGPNRFDSNDPPLFTAHGTLDTTVPYSSATDLKTIYDANGVNNILYTLNGMGHAAWGATVDGKSLFELSFDYIVEQQQLEF